MRQRRQANWTIDVVLACLADGIEARSAFLAAQCLQLLDLRGLADVIPEDGRGSMACSAIRQGTENDDHKLRGNVDIGLAPGAR